MKFGKRDTKFRIQKRAILSLMRPESAYNEELENIGTFHKIENLATSLVLSESQTKKLLSKIFQEEKFSKKDNITLTDDTYNCCSFILSQQEVVDLLTVIFVSTLSLELKQRIANLPSIASLKFIGAKYYKGFSTEFIKNHFIPYTDCIDYTYERLKYLSRIVSSEQKQMHGVLFSYLEEFKQKSKELQIYPNSMDAYYVIFSMPQVFVILNSLVRAIEWENLKAVNQPSFYRNEWSYNATAIIFRGVKDQLLPTIDRLGDDGQDILACIKEKLIDFFSDDPYCKYELEKFLEKSEEISTMLNEFGSNCIKLDPSWRITEGMNNTLIDVAKSGHKLDIKAGGKMLRKSAISSMPNNNKVKIVSSDRGKKREIEVDICNIEKWNEFKERKR